jgi:hypothetical protein
MPAESHHGSTRWRANYGQSGDYILFTNNPGIGNAFLSNGQYWNDQGVSARLSPEVVNLKTIDGTGTGVGLRTITAWTNTLGALNPPNDHLYPNEIYDNGIASSGNPVQEWHGIPFGYLVDLVMGGAQGANSTRGGAYVIHPDTAEQRRAVVVNGNTNYTGPVIFTGIEPRDGTIRVRCEMQTNFIYWNFTTLRIYRR